MHLTYFRQICRLGLSHSCLQASFVAGATCCTVPAQPEPPNHTNTGGPKMSLDPRGDRCQNCVPLAQPGQLQVQFSSNSPGSKNKEHKNAKNTEVHKEYSHLPASRIFKLSTSGVLGRLPSQGTILGSREVPKRPPIRMQSARAFITPYASGGLTPIQVGDDPKRDVRAPFRHSYRNFESSVAILFRIGLHK